MKVLFLVQDEQRIILDRLYDSVEANCDCDLRRLTKKEQANIKRYFKEHVDLTKYDRIMFFLRAKKAFRQVGFIRSVPNLVILEHDVWQNYIGSAYKYHGRFSQFYKHMPWVRVLSSGYGMAQKLKEEGTDTVFVPKGYDEELLYNEHKPRDIELGFLGSIKNEAYKKRKDMLEAIQLAENFVVTRTKSGQEYLDTLNRIKFFVAADVCFGEYMIKNFEAMACGCVLFTYDQGIEENQVLGFEDMKNVVLYQDLASFQEKLHQLRDNPQLAEQIAKNGQQLAEEHFSFKRVGELIIEALQPPLRKPTPDSLWQKTYYRLRR